MWKLNPHDSIHVHLQPTSHFILLFWIYNVYILHRLAHDHITYLQYTSLNYGFKTWMLHRRKYKKYMSYSHLDYWVLGNLKT
jgi:hypothetical protein